jgi:NAD(P)H-dependent FMN reductase
MKKISIIVGSTRDNRRGLDVAKWVLRECEKYKGDAGFVLLDIKEFDLVHYNEPGSPRSNREYKHKEVRRWSEYVRTSDGFIFVTPEYNGFITGALKDAIDYLYHEWEGKPYGMVGYGSKGARRALKYLEILLDSFHMECTEEKVGIHRVWDALEQDHIKEDYVYGDILKMVEQIEKNIDRSRNDK